MSIREYKKGEHKSSFIGLRVVVKVGDDYRQKYFNFRKAADDEAIEKMREDAKTLNAEWNMERELVQSRKERECREKRRVSSPYTTGVSGIKMKFAGGKKKRMGIMKKYFTPYFLVSGSYQGKRFDKFFNIFSRGYDMAWFKAVEFYATQKKISNYSHLLERKPPVEQFYIIYRHQCSLGHDIPSRRLPKELDPKVVEELMARS
jgi:hypothetical protein